MNDIADLFERITHDSTVMSKIYTVDVVEYFDVPITTIEEYKKIVEKYANRKIPIVNPQTLTTMPRGCILGRYKDFRESTGTYIFFPFFSHIHMPVKPGEQVWALNNQKFGFWLSRKPSDLVAEDANFTHGDRSIHGVSILNIAGEDPLAKTFNQDSRNPTNYQDVIQNSNSYKEEFQGESVPRFPPIGPDFSIQGSNNSLLVLGSASSTGEKEEKTGMIDLVVGRGQTPNTAPYNTFSNSRNYEEVDKASLNQNIDEGKLDLVNDLSRIHLSMNNNPDQDFGISFGEDAGSGPSVVLKTDKVRIYAREDIKISVGDQAGIIIKSNGEIVILPSDTGVIKLGGEDADKAILCQTPIATTAGQVIAQPIPIATTPSPTPLGGPGFGIFASKVLVK